MRGCDNLKFRNWEIGLLELGPESTDSGIPNHVHRWHSGVLDRRRGGKKINNESGHIHGRESLV